MSISSMFQPPPRPSHKGRFFRREWKLNESKTPIIGVEFVCRQSYPKNRSRPINTTNYLTEWEKEVIRHLPHLSKPQASVLGLWSFGIVLARSCGLSRVSQQMAELTEHKAGNMRQRLREWYWEKDAKAGNTRQELVVSACFVPLLKWVLSWWGVEERRLALAMDASSLGMTFVVLSLSVVYRGCAIPVAWKVLRAAHPGTWKDEWLALLAHLGTAIPSDWLVLVLADRGLYAHWLFHAIAQQGWHPFLRINLGGKFRSQGSSQYLPLSLYLPQTASAWVGTGTCFKVNPIQATLLVAWEMDYTAPWLVVTDLSPKQAQIAWYGMRSWIENGFKFTKRGGWQWQNTRMTDPARATRFWLALAVATLWVVSVGGAADASLPPSSMLHLPDNHVARRHFKGRQKNRSVSCFRLGITIILAALINHQSLPLGCFVPEPWPSG